MDKKIIALTGAKTVGKTTIAKAVQAWAIDSKIVSFATPIKEMLWQMGIPYEALNGKDKEAIIPELGKSSRELMQSLGTEWGRDLINRNIWVFAMQKQIERTKEEIIIIDDLRFENEANWVLTRGGKIIKLQRDGIDYNDQHSSEQPLLSNFITTTINATNLEDGINEAIDQIEQMFY
jgi:hypothetical protein